MRESEINPDANHLPNAITESQLADAIKASGYPLQTLVAECLKSHFGLRHEWAYLDRQTKELRAIDLLAERDLYDWKTAHPRVRPRLDLLIECKQTELPHLFFVAEPPWTADFPVLAGLRSQNVEITSDDDASTHSMGVLNALDLDVHPFMRTPVYAMTFSKAAWKKGGDLELTGVEPYNALILPLVKALQHFHESEQPEASHLYFDARLAVALAVIDGPMVAVSVSATGQSLEMVPWVRVVRHEYEPTADRWERDRLWMIEVVHFNFFQAYLDQHLLPFAERFGQLAMKHESELATGLGFVSGMGKSGWKNIEERLRPRTIVARSKRSRIIAKNVLSLFRRRHR